MLPSFSGNVQVGQIFEFDKSTGHLLGSFSRLALSARGFDKDPTIWLDGAGPTPKYILKNNMSLTHSKL